MMNLIASMILAYHANSASDEYWFGFILHHKVYLVMKMTFEEIAHFFRGEHASSKKGGHVKIRVRARVGECENLLDRAVCLGDETILQDPKWNAGIMFEKVVTEQIAGQAWERDKVPFWVAPDIALDGRNIQVKFNGAELTNEKLIRTHFPQYLTE